MWFILAAIMMSPGLKTLKFKMLCLKNGGCYWAKNLEKEICLGHLMTKEYLNSDAQLFFILKFVWGIWKQRVLSMKRGEGTVPKSFSKTAIRSEEQCEWKCLTLKHIMVWLSINKVRFKSSQMTCIIERNSWPVLSWI